MAFEIERKFLVNHKLWKALPKPEGNKIVQGYLSLDPEKTVRLRIKNTTGFITIKGKSKGISRIEHEYEIPCEDVYNMISEFGLNCIDKIRYEIKVGNHIWEVDEFFGENEGLIVAEIELSTENETFTTPEWIDKEVSDDNRYFNSQLMTNPFKTWEK